MSDTTRRGPQPAIIDTRDGLVIVNKPSGWLVHPVAPRESAARAVAADHTLTEWLRPLLDTDVLPLHRLDLETSGVVLFAENRALAGEASHWFRDGAVEKRYTAIVQGRIHRKGIVRKDLFDERRGKPLEAITRFRLIEWIGPFSHVLARPEHGRRHQIRRHFGMIGHAVVNDERYGDRRKPHVGDRLWLHAASLSLPDGRIFEAPEPPDMVEVLAELRLRYPPDASPRGKNGAGDSLAAHLAGDDEPLPDVDLGER